MKIGLETTFRDAPALCAEIGADLSTFENVRQLAAQSAVCAAAYGVSMGFAHSWAQAAVSAVKVPLLFFSTLGVCLPALHFVGLLFGARVALRQSLALLLAAMATTSVLLASFAPVAAFFVVSGSAYPFLVLMHVAIFAVCGVAGLGALRANVRKLGELGGISPPAEGVLWIWMLLYAVVGSQMAFLLSPYVGRSPGFIWVHHPQGNFYTYVAGLFVEALR